MQKKRLFMIDGNLRGRNRRTAQKKIAASAAGLTGGQKFAGCSRHHPTSGGGGAQRFSKAAAVQCISSSSAIGFRRLSLFAEGEKGGELQLMTFTKLVDFFTPSPLVRIWD